MPILRHEENQDFLTPRLIYLWDRKWAILIPAIIAFVLGYLAMRLPPEEYQVTAEIYVNRLTPLGDRIRDPNSVGDLLKSNDLLRAVRDEYAAKFNVPPPIFERFAKQFKIKLETLQDTAMRKEIAPVITLSVQSAGKEQTRFMMESWTRNFIRKFGNYGITEAKLKLESMTQQDVILEKELAGMEAQLAKCQAELPVLEKQLAEKINILAPSELYRPLQSQISRDNAAPNTQVVFNQTTERPAGLLARLSQTRLEIQRLRLQQTASNDAATSTAEAEREERALLILIDETQKNISESQDKVAEVQKNISTLTRTIELKTTRQRELHKFMDQMNVEASIFREWTDSPLPVAGDARVLTQPGTPELRVWPKRSFAAAAIAGLVFVLCIVFILLKQHFRRAAEIGQASRSAPDSSSAA
ncbi:MAG: hypothetical protein NTY46_12040 [Candidatus Sumerlaeota bacterium]|nr:hypothetical protein [Candidatus Sumerlaeota bacterium]